jgi:predicted cobalt transporter CbtA
MDVSEYPSVDVFSLLKKHLSLGLIILCLSTHGAGLGPHQEGLFWWLTGYARLLWLGGLCGAQVGDPPLAHAWHCCAHSGWLLFSGCYSCSVKQLEYW